MNDLLVCFEPEHWRWPLGRWGVVVRNQSRAISPHITVGLLEGWYIVAQSDICSLQFWSVIYDCLCWHASKSIPCHCMLKRFPNVERNNKNLPLHFSLVHHPQKTTGFTQVKKCKPLPCLGSVLKYWFVSSLQLIKYLCRIEAIKVV